LGDGQLRVRTLVSLVSTGTETTILNQLYEKGTHWDEWLASEGYWPWYPGYAVVGEVVEAANDVAKVCVGDRVALRKPHASEHVVAAEDCIPVPAGLKPEQAAWFALGKITFMGAKAAACALGDAVLIIGAGPIGQMSVRWMRIAGAQAIVVCDPLASRLELATAGGVTATVDRSIFDARDAIQAACGNQLPHIVIDSTGNAKVLQAALGLARQFGKVVLLGDPGDPASQHLTSDVITRGLTLVGAHDCHVTADWPANRVFATFFDLVRQGRFPLDGMISHTFAPDDAPQAYELLTERRGATMGLLIDWR
jgi:2-desacetyl-2-hydroxyethyl bacteriochlorophyllide A dehydrogenase